MIDNSLLFQYNTLSKLFCYCIS